VPFKFNLRHYKEVGLYRETRAKKNARLMKNAFAVSSIMNAAKKTEGGDAGETGRASPRIRTKRHASMEDLMRGGSPSPSPRSPTPTRV
jgi:hypothetical protein